MGFDEALKALKSGEKITRTGWNGKGQYVVVAYMQEAMLSTGEAIFEPEHEAIGSKFLMFVGTSGYQCGWLASQADILAEDWEVVQC